MKWYRPRTFRCGGTSVSAEALPNGWRASIGKDTSARVRTYGALLVQLGLSDHGGRISVQQRSSNSSPASQDLKISLSAK